MRRLLTSDRGQRRVWWLVAALPGAMVFGACYQPDFEFPTCDDGIKNAYESDVDCGGPRWAPAGPCGGCEVGQPCNYGYDCDSGVCGAKNDDGIGVCEPTGDIEIYAGGSQTCVRMEDNIRCWGLGTEGGLGNGDTANIGDDEWPASIGFVNVGGAVEYLAMGRGHTCAVLGDGNARCWGAGSNGELGYGEDLKSLTAPPETNLQFGGELVEQISAGAYHTCAILSGGTVRCWGYGPDGVLGYGTMDSFYTPPTSDVDVGGTVVELATGTNQTCARLEGGTVRCWGYGAEGTLGYGNGDSVGNEQTPSDAGDVPLGETVKQIVAGAYHTCALLEQGGAVRCWGYGADGALGYAGTSNIGDDETPTENVAVGGPVVQLTAGASHTCALLQDGSVRCWGLGVFGALGYGDVVRIGDDESPADVGDVDVGGAVLQLAAGDDHTCALLEKGRIRCWGRGELGALGYGNTDNIGDDEAPADAGDVIYN